MQPVTGQVIGTVYKGYRIGYELQGQNYQFETRVGIVDFIRGLGSLSLDAQVPLLVNPEKPYAALINTMSGRYGMTLMFVSLLCLFVVAMLVAAMSSRFIPFLG